MADEIEETKLLYEICSLLIKAQEDEEILNQVIEKLGYTFEAICCSIWLIKQEGVTGQERVAFYQSNDNIKDPLPNLDFLAANLVIENRKHFILHNVKEDDNFSEAQFDNLQLTACPLIFNNELIGALCIWGVKSDLGQKITNFVTLVQKVVNEITNGIYNYKYYSNFSHKRIRKELEIARHIQLSLIPKRVLPLKGVSIEARTIAANEVGGDYLDLFMTSGKNLGIAIGDVVGKGIPAALWMAMTRVTMRAAAKDDTQPHVALQNVNYVLYPDLSPLGMFVTLLYALFDPINKTILFSNAGHLPPLLFHSKTGKYEFLKVKGVYIGGVENKEYKLGGVQLRDGDIILFYTDGLTEALNESREQFGIKRVIDVISKNALYKASEIMDCLSLHLGQYVGDYRQSDDVTFALLKVES